MLQPRLKWLISAVLLSSTPWMMAAAHAQTDPNTEAAACADGSVEQHFANGMVGCGGAVPYLKQRSLCGAAYRPASAAEWVLARQNQAPTANYWVRERLLYDGTSTGDCSASASVGDACPANEPMRVCSSDGTDAFGNTCTWTHCGLDHGAPDDYFGGCATPTAGTLCVPAGCADNTVEQVFAHGLVGCGGKVAWSQRANLCAAGFRPAAAAEWVAYHGTHAPSLHYWTDDDLKNLGTPEACAVSPSAGRQCPAGAPMRVCTQAEADLLGNTCHWRNCGYELTQVSDAFGGCSGNPTAGTLCIATACADGSDEQVFSNGMVGCAGSVPWDQRDSLCGAGQRAASAAEWAALRRGAEPNNNYWTADVLNYAGSNTQCSAQAAGGNVCPANEPMRVCTANGNDTAGNHCNWTHCGFGANAPDEFLGGCQGNPTAGTLCVASGCAAGGALQVLQHGTVECAGACAGGWSTVTAAAAADANGTRRCARVGCADGSVEQFFDAGVVGCGGSVPWPARQQLCAPGWTMASASSWLHARQQSAIPINNYWTAEALSYSGSGPRACSVSNVSGSSCPKNSPMRVCSDSGSDPFGNACHWTHCGFGSNAPDQYFGGCTGNPQAGALCVAP